MAAFHQYLIRNSKESNLRYTMFFVSTVQYNVSRPASTVQYRLHHLELRMNATGIPFGPSPLSRPYHLELRMNATKIRRKILYGIRPYHLELRMNATGENRPDIILNRPYHLELRMNATRRYVNEHHRHRPYHLELRMNATSNVHIHRINFLYIRIQGINLRIELTLVF